MSISAFFPCYNDKGTIGKMVEDVFFVLKDLTDDFEIIVVDDGSTDNSQEVLKELGKKYDCLKLIFHPINQGYGGALQSGFKAASKEFIFYTDGDAQHDVKELSLLMEKMTDQIDIVNGYRVKRADPFYRIIIGIIYNLGMRMIFGLHLKDIDCDFRLMRRKIFDQIELKHKSGIICVEMIRKMEQAGFRFAQVGVSHFNRVYGVSQFFNFKRIFWVARDMVKLWYELFINDYD